MSKFTIEQINHWARCLCICFMLFVVAFTTKSCAGELGTGIGVTTYTGFDQKCEAAGGIRHSGLCLSTLNLIELDLTTGEEDEFK